MSNAKRQRVWLLVAPAVVMGCADQPPLDPGLVQQSEIESLAASAMVPPAGEVDALVLSPRLRAAMTSTLEAALAEYGIQPHAARGALQEFLRDVDARQGHVLTELDPRP